jgi:hypothetical protein
MLLAVLQDIVSLNFVLLQCFNLTPQLLVLNHLALQEPPGQHSLFWHAGGREQVGVAHFVIALAEDTYLDPVLFHKGFQAEVDTHFFG